MYIDANLGKLIVNEAYSMLLTHEAKLEANQLSASKEATLNWSANIAQTWHKNKKSWGQFNDNWNKNAGARGGYARGRDGYGRNFQVEARQL